MATINNDTLPSCADIYDNSLFTHYTCIPSVIIILILAVLEKRRSRPDLCGGRPALVIPLPLLDGYENRFSFAAAFGAITNTILSLFFNLGDTFPFNFPLWAAALVVQIQIIEACVTCFPFFACIATRHKMVGAVLGGAYSSVLLGAIITDCVQNFCKIPSSLKIIQALSVLDYLPMILCYLYLILKSVHTIIQCVRSNTYVTQHLVRRVCHHQQQFTRLVLDKNYSPRLENSSSEKFLYKKIPGFSYPVRIISVAFILVVVVYRVTMILLLTGVQLTHSLEDTVGSVNINWTIGTVTYYIFTPVAFNLLTGVYFVVTFISAALASFYIYLFMKSYRRHILRMFRGDKHFIPERVPKPQVMMAWNLRFPGYQIAYMLWGIFILFLTLVLIISILAYAIYFLSVNNFLASVVIQILQTLSFPLMALLLFYLQVVLARRVLMQDRIKATDDDPPLNVDNRRVYEIFNYYSLFGSLAIGIFSCFWRILQGTILGVFLVGRLDHSIYSRGWEHRDTGYLSYISMLHVENSHNHPILRVFCDLLLESQERPEGLDLNNSTLVSRNNQARRRWLLAFTLLNNPELQHMRKSALSVGNKRLHHLTRTLHHDLTHVTDWPIDDGISYPDERVNDNRKLYLKTISSQSDVNA